MFATGADFGIADFGMYALESLRLEKCYRAWKTDLTHEYLLPSQPRLGVI